MTIRRDRKIKHTDGFTLAELMVTVAIMGILASVSFVAVAKHQKNLKLLEMDNIAREIYTGAQNRLTQMKTDGTWDDLVSRDGTFAESTWGVSISKPDDDVAEAAGTHDYRRIIVNKGSCTDNNGEDILKRILPLGSIDDTVRQDGYYAVEYDITTAQVYAVFYTDAATTPQLASSDIDRAYSESIKPADREKRKSFKMGGTSKGVALGYYGGAAVKDVEDTSTSSSAVELQPIKASMINGSRLLLCITDPNTSIADADKTYTVTLHGTKSGAAASYVLTESGENPYKNTYTSGADTIATYTYILDSVVDETGYNRHFSRFGFDFGCDVSADVTLKSGTDDVSAVSNTTNSIFAVYDKASETAEISNARHLENISSEISSAKGTDPAVAAVKTAVITSNIAWSDDYSSDKVSAGKTVSANGFIKGADDKDSLTAEETKYNILHSNSSASDAAPQVLLSDGTKAAAGKYVGIASGTLHKLDGRSHTVANLPIVSSGMTSGTGAISGHNAGLISTVKLDTADTDKTLQISNLSIACASMEDTSDTSGHNGVLMGTFDGVDKTSSLTVNRVNIIDPYISVKGTSDASGMVGHTGTGDVQISSSAVTVTGDKPGLKEPGIYTENGNAGGFIAIADSDDENKITVFNSSITDTTSKVLNTQTAAFTVKSTETGNAGGVIGGVSGTGKDVTVNILSGSVGTLTVSSGSGNAGGLIGSASAADITVKCAGINGGAKGLVSGGSSQGGLAGLLSAKSVDVEDSYASLCVSSSGGNGTGGLIGTLDGMGTGSALVTRCYAAGRTSGGVYTSDLNGNIANVASSAGGSVGGFVGTAGNASAVTISDSYTTCSVYRAQADTASGIGGFIGTASGSIGISNSYTTALITQNAGGDGTTNAGRFAGLGGSKITTSDAKNYYLSGINKTVTKASGDGSNESVAVKAYSKTTGSPFYVDETEQKTSYPYDSSLGSSYPYKTVAQLTSVSLSGKQPACDSTHIGDWPTGASEGPTFDKQFALLYYEIVQHGSVSTNGTNLGYYYHGYAADPQKVGTAPAEYVFKEVWSDIPSSIPNNGKGLVTGHDEYVAESGYIICVENNLDLSKIGVNMGWEKVTLKSLIETAPEGKAESAKNVLVPYDSFPSGFGIDGYKIYRVNEFNANVQNHASNRVYTFNFTTSYNGLEDEAKWNNRTTFTLNPYFSDMLYPGEHEYGSVLGLRSAVQFKTQFGTISSSSYVGGWNDSSVSLEQKLDISFSDKDVIQTLYSKSQGDDAYISPTLDQIRGTFSSADFDGNPYILKHITRQLVGTINGGTIKHLHIADVDVPDMSPLIDKDQGTFSDVTIDTACSPIIGSTNGEKTVDGITIGAFNITRDCPRGLLIQDSGGSTFSNIAIGNVIFGNVILGSDGYSFGIISNLTGNLNGCVIESITDSAGTVYKGTSCGVIGHLQKQNSYGKILNLKLNGCTFQGNISQLEDVQDKTDVNKINQGAFGIIGWNESGTISADANGGYINNVSFSGLRSSAVLKDNVGIIGINDAGTFRGYNLTNIRFTNIGQAGGSIIGLNKGGGVVDNINVSYYDTDGNGFTGSNGDVTVGTITNCMIVNAQIAKNGFAGNLFNASTIKNCSIINAQIANNGFVGTMSGYGGTISGCHIYSDPSLYSDTEYYRPNVNTQDTTVSTGDRYNMVTVGLAENADPKTAAGIPAGSYSGFAGNVSGGTITDCSFTGKVYGKSAAGFVNESSISIIQNCYANAIVTATDANGAAAGFVIQVNGNIYYHNTIDKCHSVGMVISNGTAGTGAGFTGNGSSNSIIKNCYSAVWSAATGATYYAFSSSQCGSGNYYLVPAGSGFTDTVSGASGKIAAKLADLVSEANAGIFGTTKDKTPTVKYGQYNTDTADTKYPYPVPDQSYTYYGDWK